MKIIKYHRYHRPDEIGYVSKDGHNDEACKYEALKLPRIIAEELIEHLNKKYCDGSNNYYITEDAPND